MAAHAKTQASRPRRLFPPGNEISGRTQINRIPRLILTIPSVHVIVAICQRHKVLRARSFIEGNQLIRVPVGCRPERNDICEAEYGRMSVVGYVVGVVGARLSLFIDLLVHTTRIPVPMLGLALRPPMRPNANFGM